MLTSKGLIEERKNTGVGGVQRIYRLPNGYGLSLINGPELHSFAFAWEAAVLKGLTEDGLFIGVFSTDEEANAFIERAFAWAEGKMK